MHIVVAGAGVFGASIAFALARQGARVTIVDPAPVGANASGVAAGMLAPVFEALFDQRPEHFARSDGGAGSLAGVRRLGGDCDRAAGSAGGHAGRRGCLGLG